jgi:CheY-like chemotaxis protein
MDVLSLRRGVRAIVTDLGRTEDGEFRAHAGLALLRQLREAELDQPAVVYTSARGVELDRQEALEAGAAVVTASPTELFAALGRILGAPNAEPERLGPAGPPQPPRSGDRRPRRPIRPG